MRQDPFIVIDSIMNLDCIYSLSFRDVEELPAFYLLWRKIYIPSHSFSGRASEAPEASISCFDETATSNLRQPDLNCCVN